MRISLEGIALIVFISYWICVEVLRSKGVLEKYEISNYGPLLIVRTKKGLGILEKISKPKKFWRVISTAGIPSVFAGMVFMFALIVLMDVMMVKSPPPPSQLTSPRNVLLIPWVNTLFPPLYLLIGLIVTLVVHEFSHAILCRVEGIKVKALGLLMLLLPIGGFAEPDEEELEKKASRIQKVRIFSAGVISNFAVATIAFILFLLLLNFLQPVVFVANTSNSNTTMHAGEIVYSINGVNVSTPADVAKALEKTIESGTIVVRTESGIYKLHGVCGVKVVGLYKNYPAEKAGIKPGMIIYMINETYTPNLYAFQKYMSKTKPGEVLTLHVYYKGKREVIKVRLVKSPYSNSGFLGVEVYGYVSGLTLGYSKVLLDELKSIPSELKSVRGWLLLVAMPLMGFKGFTGSVTKYFKPMVFGSTLFVILTALYWICWVNFYVGLFNCLPAIPLDGGRVLYEVLVWIANKFGFSGEKVAEKVVKFLAYLIFVSLALSVVIPNLTPYLKTI